MKANNKSFTLIELLVVIVIIGILAGVIMISTSSSIDKANFAKAQAFSSTVQNELLSNLVSEWTFDEPQEGNITKDSWGNNHGTVVGATQVDDCVFGKCYSFNGDDYINCGNNISLNISNTITMSAWIKPTTLTQSNGPEIICKGSSSTDYRMRFEYGGTVSARFFGTTNPDTYGVTKLKTDRFNFIVMVYNGSKNFIYINGILDIVPEINTGTITNSTQSLILGANPSGTEFFNGLIDDVRIYNSALSSAQIKKEYMAGLESLYSKGVISKDEFNKRLGEVVLTKLPSRSIFQLYDK